jgi:3-methyladenine DNA glycosylase/8-oxoguanine DNA glycosylase
MFEIREQASWQLCLTDALRPFYEICKGDPIMEMAISMHYGAKDKGRFSLFEAIIDCICAQNVIFKRLYTMMDNLCKRFGDKVEIEGRVYHAFPTPMQLASATLDEIRLCGVGYRAKFIKNFAEMVACGEVNLEKIKKLPINEAIEELMQIEGVGPYTANLSMILAMRRREILHLDSFVREILSQLYFEGRKVSDEELQTFAAQRWLGCQAYATLLLCTDTEMLFRNVGKEFRLKSGARR